MNRPVYYCHAMMMRSTDAWHWQAMPPPQSMSETVKCLLTIHAGIKFNACMDVITAQSYSETEQPGDAAISYSWRPGQSRP